MEGLSWSQLEQNVKLHVSDSILKYKEKSHIYFFKGLEYPTRQTREKREKHIFKTNMQLIDVNPLALGIPE